MLDFYLGTDGVDSSPDKRLGGLEADAVYWLQQNGLIEKGETGHLPDLPESFPYFDDVILSFEQVVTIHKKFSARVSIIQQTHGFDFAPVNLMGFFLRQAMQNQTGLSTIAD